MSAICGSVRSIWACPYRPAVANTGQRSGSLFVVQNQQGADQVRRAWAALGFRAMAAGAVRCEDLPSASKGGRILFRAGDGAALTVSLLRGPAARDASTAGAVPMCTRQERTRASAPSPNRHFRVTHRALIFRAFRKENNCVTSRSTLNEICHVRAMPRREYSPRKVRKLRLPDGGV